VMSMMSLATWAALPTSVWIRMYAVTTGTDLLDHAARGALENSCREDGGMRRLGQAITRPGVFCVSMETRCGSLSLGSSGASRTPPRSVGEPGAVVVEELDRRPLEHGAVRRPGIGVLSLGVLGIAAEVD
jgi:hypothetical protein